MQAHSDAFFASCRHSPFGVPRAPARVVAAGLLATLAFAAIFVGERLRPLRARTQSSTRRLGITVAFASTAGAATALAYMPVVFPAALLSARRRIGLLRWTPVPRLLRPLLAILLLDYSLWAWHRLTHRVPILWRFHGAHHADLDLDVLTALRFHFGEMLASMPFRAAQAFLIGVDLPTLLMWEWIVVACAEFHHSNLRLPLGFEGLLRQVFVTPRLHGVHHSIDAEESSSNFGTILSVWDRLHGLHRWQTAEQPAIGLASLRNPMDLTPLRALMLPFSSRAPRLPAGSS